MCGRVLMFRAMDEYVRELDPQGDFFAKVDKTPSGATTSLQALTFLSFTLNLTLLRSTQFNRDGSVRSPGLS
ncbi:hypothetical protein BOH74_18615 [Pseudomonas versuta]|uniref:Uncharacterized protein n=1 Tax=Pseudomonas versuta TaxID=1788301 RepID=A0A853ZRG7_9PSED|nr:hypothetical protein BOH74_18615 [Pseudomonas versuta]